MGACLTRPSLSSRVHNGLCESYWVAALCSYRPQYDSWVRVVDRNEEGGQFICCMTRKKYSTVEDFGG